MTYEEQIQVKKIELEALIEKDKKARARKKIPCASCGQAHMIKDIDLLDIQYYTEPYGCTGGDYWSHAEYNFRCLSCTKLNRFLFSSIYYKIDWVDRKHHNPELYFFREYLTLFKSKELVYPPRSQLGVSEPFVNNYYIENNIKKFLSRDSYERLMSYVKG